MKNIIANVESLIAERQKLIADNQTLVKEIQALKVALNEQNEVKNKTKQHGDDEKISRSVDLSEDLSLAEAGSTSKIDTKMLKQQIESALEEIDQCIHIISAK